MSVGWIGVDLDGTLACRMVPYDPSKIGPPIFPMVLRVREWLADDKDVRIFTARVSGERERPTEVKIARMAIIKFCVEMFGKPLIITCTKNYDMIELWDDRAVAVQPDTGLAGRWVGGRLRRVS